jgi:putative aldouronate transport system permease protein
MQLKKLLHSDGLFDAVVTVIIILITLVILYPLYFVVIASISDPSLVTSGQVILIPKGLNVDGYKFILRDHRILTGYGNTIFYTVFGTVLALVITIPAGYALSRKDLPFRNLLMMFVLFTKFFSGGLIPTYLVVNRLGLVNTRYVLIILGAFSVFNLILCRTFFVNTLPDELREAAEVDGCGTFRFFMQIVLPLSSSIIAIMVLYYAVSYWNSFFNALIYVSDNKYYPLQMIMRDILITGQSLQADITDPEAYEEMLRIAQSIRYGIIIVSSLPVLMLYPFVQKHFVKGVMIGSLKG